MTRHASLADQLQALMAYRNRPEGDLEPVQTNWAVAPSNDNNPEDVADLRTERRVNIRPTVDRIMAEVTTGAVERNDEGQVVRIGTLTFSDGAQRERGYRLGIDGNAEPVMLQVPAGGMLRTSENQERTMGGDDNPQEVAASNNHFRDMLGAGYRRVAGGKRRPGKSYTHTEARVMLAEAYANTSVLPPITKCPLALPSAGSRISDSFLGMQKSRCADTGSQGWEDISTALVDREVWAHALAMMSDRDTATLDAAQSARAFTDLAEGRRGGNAYAAGKRRLQAANDNFSEILKKVAA